MRGGRCMWRISQRLCDTLEADPHPRPGWRNWQTQQTQNLPALVVMGVRPPLPAPALNRLRISDLQKRKIVRAQFVPRICPSSSHRHHKTVNDVIELITRRHVLLRQSGGTSWWRVRPSRTHTPISQSQRGSNFCRNLRNWRFLACRCLLEDLDSAGAFIMEASETHE